MKPIDLTERLGRWSSGHGPLYLLLAGRLRQLIDNGDLPPGTLLPPDRALASALALGRSTVVATYDLLRTEGRIVRRQGSGTRVAGEPSRAMSAAELPDDTTDAPVFLHLLEPRDDVIPLGCAAPDAVPPELTEAYARVLPELAATTNDIGYHPQGHLGLRRAIAEHYERRGAPTRSEQILVTTGAQQALSLLARALLRPGGQALVEAPTYPGALEAFREEGAVLRALPVGLEGFEATVGEHRPALAYVVSTFHNPTGAVLPALARRRLAKVAGAADVPLIDDEALTDLGFPEEEHPPPIAAYSDAVISVGSLSKIVWGGLRVGWVRAPVPLITRLARLRAVHDLGGNTLAQLAAADLLPRLEPLRCRRATERKACHDHLRAELGRHLPDWDAPPARGGQTLWVRLPRGDGGAFAQAALRHRVAVLPGSGLDAADSSRDYLRLHFIASPKELSEAVRRLAVAWRGFAPSEPPATPLPSMAV
ncbi:PLP-dependent aminotransferase family protein [Nocardiopsis rhodophaea]|uniref:PLP-dependent aminotransferase family protein n=1 Tax=Nocardiopsis rhodophaea TaxID=280238 RepID=A0ABP5ET13_9ACTN